LLTYRLAAPALRPAGDTAPGIGHEILENIGLFGFHLASVLAAVVLALFGIPELFRGRDLLDRVVGGCAALLALAALLLQFAPSTFALEVALHACYGLAVIAVVVVALARTGDLGVRLGVALFALPLLVHVAAPIVTHLMGEESMFSGLPETITNIGHWTLIVAASASPYCFAPRPFVRSAMRPAPALIGTFVGLIAAIIVRKHFEVGATLASYGLGVELGPGIPQHKVALALLALGTLSWTLVSCFLARSAARRRIGVGIALLLVAGYGFTWPMQFTLGALGLLVMARAGREVEDQEPADAGTGYFKAPPVEADTWQAYVQALCRALSSEDEATSVTTHHEGNRQTRIHAILGGMELSVEIEAEDDSIARIDVLVGEVGQGEPAWTMAARPEKRHGVHPSPPHTSAPAIKTGDAPFDERFRVRGSHELCDQLLDNGLRARATALIDGWVAWWPGKGLGFRVCPGRGAPVDHPIPITELAFRPAGGPINVDKMTSLLQLLRDIASRGDAPG
jgi:hypothetical protein